MNFGDISPLDFANNLMGPEDERKESCIHCLKEWYSIDYKDGVCPACQEKKLPGREAIFKKEP